MIIWLMITPVMLIIYTGCMIIAGFLLEACGVKNWVSHVFMLLAAIGILNSAFTLNYEPTMKPPVGYVYITPAATEQLIPPATESKEIIK